MAQPTPGDVHVNTPLTNVLNMSLQSDTEFVSTQVFPELKVSKQSDVYYTIDDKNFNRDEGNLLLRAPGTESQGGGYTLDANNTYRCTPRAFHHDIPDDVRRNADSVLELDRQATLLCSRKLLINREKAFVTNFVSAGKWTTQYTGAATPATGELYQWSDYTNSDPITDLENAIQAVRSYHGIKPNKLVLGAQVWAKLKHHPDIIDRLKYGQTAGKPAMATKEGLAAILEIDQVLEAGAIEVTSKEGATSTTRDFIVGKKALLVYSPPAAGIMVATGGYTFLWNDIVGGESGYRIKKIRAELLNSDRIEAETYWDMQVVNANLGAYFATIVA